MCSFPHIKKKCKYVYRLCRSVIPCDTNTINEIIHISIHPIMISPLSSRINCLTPWCPNSACNAYFKFQQVDEDTKSEWNCVLHSGCVNQTTFSKLFNINKCISKCFSIPTDECGQNWCLKLTMKMKNIVWDYWIVIDVIEVMSCKQSEL